MAAYTSIGSGDWNDPGIWTGGPAGTYPGQAAGDTATIDGQSVTMAFASETALPYPVATQVINGGYFRFACTYVPTHAHFVGLVISDDSACNMANDAENQVIRISLDPPATGHAFDCPYAWLDLYTNNIPGAGIVFYLNNSATRHCGINVNGMAGALEGDTGVTRKLVLHSAVSSGATQLLFDDDENPVLMVPKVGDILALGPVGGGAASELVEITAVDATMKDFWYASSLTLTVRQFPSQTAGVAYPHAAGCPIANLSSNIKFIGRIDQPTNSYLTSSPDMGMVVKSCEFRNFGAYADVEGKNGLHYIFSPVSTYPVEHYGHSFWQDSVGAYPRKYACDFEHGFAANISWCAGYNAVGAGGSMFLSRQSEVDTGYWLADCIFMENRGPLVGTAIGTCLEFAASRTTFIGACANHVSNPTAILADADANTVYNVPGPQPPTISFDDCEFHFLQAIVTNAARPTSIKFGGCRIGITALGTTSTVADVLGTAVGAVVMRDCTFDPTRHPESLIPAIDPYAYRPIRLFSVVGSNLTPATALVLTRDGFVAIETIGGEKCLVGYPSTVYNHAYQPGFEIGSPYDYYRAFTFPASAGDVVTVSYRAWLKQAPPAVSYYSPSVNLSIYGPRITAQSSQYASATISKSAWSTPVTVTKTYAVTQSGLFYVRIAGSTGCTYNADGRNNAPIVCTFPVVSGNSVPADLITRDANLADGYPLLGYPVRRDMPIGI